MSAGAYGAVQAGTYNTRALVPEVLVNGAEWALVRPRVEVDAADRARPVAAPGCDAGQAASCRAYRTRLWPKRNIRPENCLHFRRCLFAVAKSGYGWRLEKQVNDRPTDPKATRASRSASKSPTPCWRARCGGRGGRFCGSGSGRRWLRSPSRSAFSSRSHGPACGCGCRRWAARSRCSSSSCWSRSRPCRCSASACRAPSTACAGSIAAAA